MAEAAHETSTEAIVGGVTGTVSRPETLLLGRCDYAGKLRYVGRTHSFGPVQQLDLVSLLIRSPHRRSGGVDHPWPQALPASWSGQLERPRPLPYIQVDPEVVVEIRVDTAFEYRRWRHRVHHLRPRLDMSVYTTCRVHGDGVRDDHREDPG